MAAIRLEFAQFGHFDYFKIYRNLTSTNIEDLGQPIGTSSTMYYEDSTVEPNLSYFYRVGVVRDLVEEFSEEINVTTEVVFDPPYNLQGTWNNTTQSVDLTWDLDGIVLEQRYYCETSPINPGSLPEPKAVLDGEARQYIDHDVIDGETYYIRVGSFRGGIEKISSEVVIVATTITDEHFDSVVVLLNFENGLVDATEKRTWTAIGGATTTNVNPLYGSASLDLLSPNPKSIYTPHAADLNIGSGDFTIEFSLTCQSVTDGYHPIMGKRNGYGSGESFTIYKSNAHLVIDFYYDFGGYRQSVMAANVFSQTNTKYDVQIIKNGLVLIVALNGVQKTSFNLSSHIANSSAPLHIGQASFNEGSVFGGLIDEVRITSGVARAIAAKTEPFPTI